VVKKAWLLASAFGVMFAALSWMQESGILPPVEDMGAWKGVLSVITGAALAALVNRGR